MGYFGAAGLRSGRHGWDATVEHDRYSDPETAPFDKPLKVEVRDGQGPYRLRAFCIRTKDGWVSAVSRKPLVVEVIGWKYG